MTQDVSFDDKSAPTNTPPEKSRSKHKKKKDIHWLGEPSYHISGETSLWLAVITQAMMDALSRAGDSESRYYKHEAIHWLTGNSKHFITVCLYAGLDPDYVRCKAKRALVSPQLWRAEAGKGKRYLERKAYRKRMKAKTPAPSEPGEHPSGSNVIIGPWPAH